MKRRFLPALIIQVCMAGAVGCAYAQVPAELADYNCIKSEVGSGQVLSLSGATLSFDDEFTTPAIVRDGDTGTWYAPIHSPFGPARFLPYSPGKAPFLYDDGHLTIRMQRQNGEWTSGIIQSVDRQGAGFSQRQGYFEMRAKLPPGKANWPAFWLKSVNEYTEKKTPRVEIDVLEAYGGNDQYGYHATVHLWPRDISNTDAGLKTHWGKSCYRRIPDGLFDGEFHTFGARITPEWVEIYLDRREIMRFPSLPEFNQPLFILADLAYNTKEKRVDDAPSDMVIDYIRVWQWN